MLSFLIIQTTAHTSWGWRSSNLKIAFYILIHSNLNYSAPEWSPWQSATSPSCLDSLQNRALRHVTGQLVSTPLEAFCLQVDVLSYNTCSNLENLILRAWEKTLHSTDYHPKRVALSANVLQRLPNCCSFHHKANDLSTLFPAELEHRQIINHFPSPPWQCITLRKKHISTFVLSIADWDDYTASRFQSSLTYIASYWPGYIIYIDGSGSEGTRNGGAAAVITRGPPLQREVLTTIKTKSRTYTSYHKEEAAAMESSLSWTSTTAIIHQSTFLFVQIANLYVKHSYHRIHVRLLFMNTLIPFFSPFTFNGFQDIVTFQAMN